jgi:nuclear GTP-binding protein
MTKVSSACVGMWVQACKYNASISFGSFVQFEYNSDDFDLDLVNVCGEFIALSGVSQKAYLRELKKVLEVADVLLEVLDVRDPLGCRCKAIETAIAGDMRKKIILVLNKIGALTAGKLLFIFLFKRVKQFYSWLFEPKIDFYFILSLQWPDLVPQDSVQKWLTYFRQSYPTIAFKASTQQK